MDVTAVNGVNVTGPMEVIVTGLIMEVVAMTDELARVVVVVAGVMPDARAVAIAVSPVDAMSAVEAMSTVPAVTGFRHGRASDHQTHDCDTCNCEILHCSNPVLVVGFRDRQDLPFVWTGVTHCRCQSSIFSLRHTMATSFVISWSIQCWRNVSSRLLQRIHSDNTHLVSWYADRDG